jgi:hypothetical protein
MKAFTQLFLPVLYVCAVHSMDATPSGTSQPAPSVTISGGMGVSYVNPTDIIDLVNASSIQQERQADFKSTVVFFGAVRIPFSPDWSLKVEYGYQLGSWSVGGFFGNTDVTMTAHLPSVLLEYALALEPSYTFHAGIGGGYHIGLLRIDTPLESTFVGHGGGVLLDLEADTAFGDNLYGYIDVDVQWEFIGALKDANGNSPGPTETAMNYFGPGVKFGLSYHL